MITITFPDGREKQYPKGTTALDIAKSISESLARAALDIKINGQSVHSDFKVTSDATIKIITFKDKEGQDALGHSCAHLLAATILELYPSAENAIGPPIEDGFYQDFELPHPISEADFPKIEERMHEIAKTWTAMEGKEVTKNEALQQFKWNKYKTELIKEFAKDGKKLTFYTAGTFIDLCKGGHLLYPGKHLKHFKLLKVAGAYWRGNEKNTMLTRIYGTVFPEKKQLDEYLHRLEEAKKRDHRVLGKKLDLFEVSEHVGPGLIFWLPKGNVIKEELENWAKETERNWGYQRVSTPIITKEGLFYTSEHLPHYKESMYSPMKIDDENYYIKPMNCPFHHTIYGCRKRSYRELPLRLAEYGWCHRYEDSGALMGMMRVRGMMMNDAHIYCTKDQAIQEFVDVIKLHQYYYDILGITDYWMELCLRNPESKKYHGDDEMWKEAEDLMKKAMDISGVKYIVQNDGAAFYGPKIDFQIRSVTGRIFTASTNQIDLFMPKKFKLTYDGKDGTEHTPVVIHRAPLGTHERFVGFLIEHFAGKFPLWLSPVQVKIVPVANTFLTYADAVKKKLFAAGFRVEVDDSTETLNKKIRNAQLEYVNYILVVGEKEQSEDSVNIRTRDNQIHGMKKLDRFIAELSEERGKRL